MAVTADTSFRKAFLLFLVVGMTLVMVVILKAFLMTIVSAAVLSGLLRPVYLRLLTLMRGHTLAASGTTVLLTLVVIIGPLIGIGGLVVGQAAALVLGHDEPGDHVVRYHVAEVLLPRLVDAGRREQPAAPVDLALEVRVEASARRA